MGGVEYRIANGFYNYSVPLKLYVVLSKPISCRHSVTFYRGPSYNSGNEQSSSYWSY